MAQLVVTPCATCGAPLELPDETAVEQRCPFCGARNSLAPASTQALQGHPWRLVGGVIGFLGGLVLFVLGVTTLANWVNGGDADHVYRLSERAAADAPSGVVGATRAARMPDGSLWVACTHNRLCGVSEAGVWLGAIELPTLDVNPDADPLRYGPTRGMAADRAGRLYVSYSADLLEVSVSERRVVGRVDALPPGERPGCLAVAPDDSLVMMTSEDDLVALDAARQVRARWRQPLLQHDARHHGCDTLTHDEAGQVWVAPEGAPAIYVFAPDGALVRRHVPGGTGHYMGLAVLADGSVVTGHYARLLLLGPDFAPRTGPATSRDPGWAEVSEVIRTPADELVVTTLLGTVARWDGASSRW